MSRIDKAALTRFEQKFSKDFGEGSIARKAPEREVVTTGSLLLDQALGVGGLVVGRCYEGWGPQGLGKTTMALVMAAEQQRRFPGKMIGWLDVEQSFDEGWAKAHGVDMQRLWLASPGNAEDVSDQVRSLLTSGLCSFVVVDSIGAMIGKKEIEKDAEEATVGVVAKIVTRMIKMAAPAAAHHQATLYVINQVRAQIGGYGPDTAPGGGFALQHGTTAQLTFRGTGETPPMVGSGKNQIVVGKAIAVKITKNKVAPPNATAMITLLNQVTAEYGPIGINPGAEAFELANKLDLWVDRSGSWYTLSDGSRHNGIDAVKAYLRLFPKVIADIRERALTKVADTVITDEMKEGTA